MIYIMKHRLFKSEVPKDIIINYIKNNFVLENGSYMIDNMLFRKLHFEQKLGPVVSYLKEFYHLSKQKYINNISTYKQFVTVLRQVLSFHEIPYSKKIKYANNTYNIFYFIHIE